MKRVKNKVNKIHSVSLKTVIDRFNVGTLRIGPEFQVRQLNSFMDVTRKDPYATSR